MSRSPSPGGADSLVLASSPVTVSVFRLTDKCGTDVCAKGNAALVASLTQVVSDLAISNLDIEVLQHRMGCAIVQILDLVGQLAELERQKYALARELEGYGYLNPEQQSYLDRVNTRLRLTAQAAFQRYPNSESLHRYTDANLQTLAGRFSSNPASLEHLVDEYRQPRSSECLTSLPLILRPLELSIK